MQASYFFFFLKSCKIKLEKKGTVRKLKRRTRGEGIPGMSVGHVTVHGCSHLLRCSNLRAILWGLSYYSTFHSRSCYSVSKSQTEDGGQPSGPEVWICPLKTNFGKNYQGEEETKKGNLTRAIDLNIPLESFIKCKCISIHLITLIFYDIPESINYSVELKKN